ncbi:MAG: hypothetical protein WB626_08610 [Bacteroidota bacterium]
MRPRRIHRLLPLLALLHAHAPAQETFRPEEPSAAVPVRRNSVATTFERNRNTFHWSGTAALDTGLAGGRLSARQRFSSSIILMEASGSSPQRRLVTDEYTAGLSLVRPISPRLAAQASWSSVGYSDTKAVGLSTASSHAFEAGGEWRVTEGVTLSPLGGYRWENQGTADDRGPQFTLQGRVRTGEVAGTLLDGEARFHQERVAPRLAEKHGARLGIRKTFEGNTRDSLELSALRSRREYYTPGDSTRSIDSRLENILAFTNRLDYEPDGRMSASLFIAVTARALEKESRAAGGGSRIPEAFGTNIDEFRLETHLEGSYRSEDGRREAMARIAYGERNESHAVMWGGEQSGAARPAYEEQAERERSKNNLSRRTAAAASARFPTPFSDTLLVTGSASLLRYDTPSDLNNEERDELLAALSITSLHRLGEALHVGLTLEGNLSHTVYLLSRRSAGNNYNRVLRFSPRALFTPQGGIASLNTFEVLANYTVYDFEREGDAVRSFSYREFGWMDSTHVPLGRALSLDFLSYLKFYERGQLRWSEFRERTENSFTDLTYHLMAAYHPSPGVRFGVGYRRFSQTRYGYPGGQRAREGSLFSEGPTCQVAWESAGRGGIVLEGWYERSGGTGAPARQRANMTMNVRFHL